MCLWTMATHIWVATIHKTQIGMEIEFALEQKKMQTATHFKYGLELLLSTKEYYSWKINLKFDFFNSSYRIIKKHECYKFL